MSEAPGEAASTHDRPRWRRAAPLVLAAGVLVLWSTIGPKLPKDHRVVVRLGDAAPEVTEVELAWTDASSGEPAAGSTLRFAPGKAPRSVQANAHLADGPWTVEVGVERAGAGTRRIVRRIDLGPGEVVLPLEDALR